MGYTTYFEGEFRITPQLSNEAVQELNDFCKQQHEDKYPGTWCSWEFCNTDAYTVMRWNGMEKAYNMEEWATALRDKFFPDANVTGTVDASGEEPGDLWKLVSEGSVFYRLDGKITYQ